MCVFKHHKCVDDHIVIHTVSDSLISAVLRPSSRQH